MSSTLAFSMFEEYKEKDKNEDKEQHTKQKTKEQFGSSRNRTVKFREGLKSKKKAEEFLNSLKPSKETYENESDDDDEMLTNFSTKTENFSSKTEEEEEKRMLQEGLKQREQIEKVQENFQRMHQNRKDNLSPYLSELNNEFANYYNNKAEPNNNSNNILQSESDLMKKLNYVVHMLEEQQDEKTQSITEELILYTFLGIFVIFIVDSFSKVTKYKR